MKVDTLVEKYPRLYHMAHEGAWPAIVEHGLLSVEALLDLYGIEGEEREAHFARHRPEKPTTPQSHVRRRRKNLIKLTCFSLNTLNNRRRRTDETWING